MLLLAEKSDENRSPNREQSWRKESPVPMQINALVIRWEQRSDQEAHALPNTNETSPQAGWDG